jgi:hypothetical protein
MALRWLSLNLLFRLVLVLSVKVILSYFLYLFLVPLFGGQDRLEAASERVALPQIFNLLPHGALYVSSN